MRSLLALFALAISAFGHAETLVSAAKVMAVTERTITLQVGTEPLVVEDSATTRFWNRRSPAKRDFLTPGAEVMVRVKTDADPPQLRELADPATWAWLERLRKEPQEAVIEKADAKSLTVKLSDGTPFTFRMTDKSTILLTNGDPSQSSSLKTGQKVFVKGRLLSNLDTWLVELRDTPFAATASKTSSKAKKNTAPKVLPDKGSVEVKITGHVENLRMINALMGIQTLHFHYDSDTRWKSRGKRAGPSALAWGIPAKIAYTRDKFGRLRANVVELYP